MMVNPEIYKARRKRFTDEILEYSCVILPNRKLSIRSNDVEYKFKPESNFYYLTGFEEPNSVCIIKKDKKSFEYFLFVEPKNEEKEIWVGKKTGLEGAKHIYRADKSYSIHDFKDQIKKLISDSQHIYFPLGQNDKLERKITKIINELKTSNRTGTKSPNNIIDPRDIIHKMRLIKDKYEIDCIKKAGQISKEAHIKAMLFSKPRIYEYELEALIEYTFRKHGGTGAAYPTIVGSGYNSTVLHYIRNNRQLKNGDLILIDAGAEYNFYASDVTRTFPVSKKFSSVQKDLYEIVLKAQIEAIKEIKPGKRFNASYDRAVSILVEGLKDLKLLKGSKEKIIKKGEYKKFFMHKLSHWLGSDVHDAGPYRDEKEKSIKLAPGMVLTVVPVIYISKELNVPERFKGIGIRIEDDILVTKTGNEVLTKNIPKLVEEIESLKI